MPDTVTLCRRPAAAWCALTPLASLAPSLVLPINGAEQGVAFVRERDNPHDPHAVSIRTLDDRSLGYVARDQTFHFTQAGGWEQAACVAATCCCRAGLALRDLQPLLLVLQAPCWALPEPP